MATKDQALIVNLHNATMLSVDKIYLHEDDICMEGSIMGAMPGCFYVRPVDLYKMYKMVSWGMIKRIPGLLRQGKKEALTQ